MNGWEQLAVWLFGILMAAATVMAAVKARSDAQVAVANAQLEAAKAYLDSHAQRGPTYMPPEWTKDGGL